MEGWTGTGNTFGTEGWTGSYTTEDGLITITVNDPDEEFYIDAQPNYSPRVMRTVLAMARHHGLEPMDEDECEPEILEDGSVRLYLVQGAAPVAPVQPVKVSGRTKVVKRSLAGLALAACVAGGAFLPSPAHHDYDIANFRVVDEPKNEPRPQELGRSVTPVGMKGN